jgi:hypothetical protein
MSDIVEVPQKHAKGWVKYCSKSWPDMPQMLTLDLGPGEKGMSEKQALLSKRKMTCASQPSGLPRAPQSGCQEPEPG